MNATVNRPAATVRPTDGCRTGRPRLRERGSRHNRVQAAVRESVAR